MTGKDKKNALDKFIINFKDSMKLVSFEKIAIPTGVKGLVKYKEKTKDKIK